MLPSILICSITCIIMILSVLFFPKIKLGKISLDTYWIVTLIGVIILLASGQVNLKSVGNALIANNAINPLKILVLFISMTLLSIFLDELGFFRHLAGIVLKRANKGQLKLFIYLYILVSILTIFTSNDIIILSFTPFICYFAKNAKIDPTPYLAAEFVAANTWSILLIIGNPTNIYLASAYGIDFLSHIKYSILPTLFAGLVSFIIMFILFRNKLKAPIEGEAEEFEIKDKVSLWVGIIHLGICTLFLAISSYVGIEMWIVSIIAVGSLCISSIIISIVRKEKPQYLVGCLKRLPYQLVPFVLSMFIMIIALSDKGVTNAIGNLLGEKLPILTYGLTSFLSANLINNIPMSVLFSSIISSSNVGLGGIFATIVGSNLGAIFTPIGALAGLMWSKILNEHNIKFGYLDFLKIGVIVTLPSLFAALGGLFILL